MCSVTPDSRAVVSPPVKATVGVTLPTVTSVVYSVKPPSLSMILALTVLVAGPSGNVQLSRRRCWPRRRWRPTGRRSNS